jgi:NhaP-type Na+/H+ and K+/H+ antiporter
MEHGLDTGVIAVVAASALLWSLLSARLERLYISAPIAFVVLGLIFTHGPLALVDIHLRSSTARSIAEVTLALVLFVDASCINVRKLRADAGPRVRLLSIGLHLTIGLGCIAGPRCTAAPGSGWLP